jgi:hypothetical protein
MAKMSRKKAKRRRHPLVKIANGWRKSFQRGDKVTLLRRGKRTDLLVNRVLGVWP